MQHKLRAGAPAGAGAAEVYDEFVHLVRFLTAGERAHDDALSLAQHSLLGYIARNPGCRATDISDVFGVNRSTVSRQLRSCIDAGWVEANSGPARLGHPLHLTEAGTTVLTETVARRHGEVRAGLAGWGEDDIERFTRLLRRFRCGVDPASARTPDQNNGDLSA
ncbi:MarR family winged helix-turn-helix transcriptional regulator [Rhodococcus chondri]|uniref:MarR family winged helix-turn-helix transcriptional regulator n=1 Tax=Rhodococcus chondri TaxID=3065941 RepID=A0ABU7JVI4_9NOCA|nr:MarR family winged helix-turn-helix transcriptional regulator [Rhodococcus sp. CC-R104]MEE2034039.1 MarR family winged helix-turn-helix transcriptional regulator [Rhodococcus sp. CC-R104]